MSASIALDQRTRELLREANDWRLLGLCFERPRPGWLDELAALARDTCDERLREAAQAARDTDEGAYLGLLGPGGLAPAREAGYRRAADPAETLAWLQAAYRAFAFEPKAEDPPDHVALLCGFRGWLALKQAYALAGTDETSAALAAELAQCISSRHLALVAEPLVERLGLATGSHALAAARALLARVGPRPLDVEGGWVPQGLDGSSCAAACGAGDRDECDDDVLSRIAGELRDA